MDNLNKTQRKDRMGEQIRRILSDLQIEGEFANLQLPYFTITEVKLKKGTDFARIYVSANSDIVDEITEKLNENKKFIRYQLAQRLTIKTVPDIRFITDETYEKAKRIEELLNKN